MLPTSVAHVRKNPDILTRLAQLCASVALLGSLGCSGGAIDIDVQDNTAMIHIAAEGNSSTPIRSLRISPANNQGSPTYAVQGSFDFKSHDLPLHSGTNATTTFEVSHGNFRVTAPDNNGTTFNLQANQPYLVEVCFSRGCHQNEFTLHE
jgi:hypothetical protein